MMWLLRFRPGCAAGLQKNNVLNLTATFFGSCLEAHLYAFAEFIM